MTDSTEGAMPPLPEPSIFQPPWSLICKWSDMEPGPGAGFVADQIDEALRVYATDYAKAYAAPLLARVAELQAERDRLAVKAAKYDQISTPEIKDFLSAVENEALYQREKWAASGDAGKSDADWFWLLGYLGGKAVQSGSLAPIDVNYVDKRLHHIITTAAACLNWHAARVGTYQDMRPGIDGDAALAANKEQQP